MSNIFHLYVISNFYLYLLLSFVIIAVFLAKLANFSCSIMAYAVMASYFLENFKKRLRNSQRSNLKN